MEQQDYHLPPLSALNHIININIMKLQQLLP